MKLSPLFFCLGLLFFGSSISALSAAETSAGKNGYTVMVEIKTNENGEVESVSLVNSEDKSADEVLTKMALAMAMNTKVPPRTKDGKPTRTTFRAPFFFPVEDDEGPAADNVPKPKVKQATQPVYPLKLREEGVVGGAILELVVDDEGKLKRVTTLRASHPEFEESATNCIKTWTFVPAQSDGKPVESRTRFAFTFDTEEKMADIKWRIAPRPKLGSLIVIKPTHPIPEEPAAATPAPETSGTPAPATVPPGK